MDNLGFQKKYQKYKICVKIWEKNFRKKFGRVPSKHDIREAPKDIRDSYKMYYKLKTSFLEDTLGEALSEDGFDISETIQPECENGNNNDAENSQGPKLPSSFSFLENGISKSETKNEGKSVAKSFDEAIVKEFDAITTHEQNNKAWRKSIGKEKIKLVETTDSIKKPMLKLKLSNVPSFNLRNPRKPIFSSAVNSSSQPLSIQSSQESNEILRDLETILIEKAKERQKCAAKAAASTNNSLLAPVGKELIITNVDKGWLNRCEEKNVPEQVSNTLIDKNDCSKSPRITPLNGIKTFGLSNLNVSKIIPELQKMELASEMRNVRKPSLQKANNIDENGSDSVVSNSEDENKSLNHRHIVKRRRVGITATKKNAITQSPNHPDPNERNKSSDASTVVSLKTKDRRESSIHENTILNDSEDSDEQSLLEIKKALIQNNVPRKQKEQKSGKVRKRSSVKKSKTLKIVTESENKEEMPNTEDLKFNFALENIEVSFVPRIDAKDLASSDVLAHCYINKNQSDLIKNPTENNCKPASKEKQEAAKRKLMEKITSGKLNENYVKINIQKKVFARGKKPVNFSKYKKKLWKDKKKAAALIGSDMNMGGCDGGVLLCFTCGQPGHFAGKCTFKGDKLLPLSAQVEEDESPFPTLEEVETMASNKAVIVHSRNIEKLPQAINSALYRDDYEEMEVSTSIESARGSLEKSSNDIEKEEQNKKYVRHQIPKSFLEKAGLLDSTVLPSAQGNSSFYDLNPDGSVKEVTAEVLEVLHMFGYTDFRKGQDRAIMRILSGLSTLVTLSTGSGKSLCYQLPAYIYSRRRKSITLVISPLVSLMEDQAIGVPQFLRAHCLHTNQTPDKRAKILRMINNEEIDILLVSPEAVISGERSTGFGSILKQLPPIAFACIDETHCVSQWSHNFRPSYLMICKVLRKNLGIKTILGLTATATMQTRKSIIQHLGIGDVEQGIISDTPLPDNLILSVSKDENRDAALVQLLSSSRFETCQSIIIYCTRRNECERVAGIIRTCMQAHDGPISETKNKRKRVNWHAEPYHAGMPASRRRTIQNAFMKNELRIIVATIAFGMGINKSDIRSVIHYNMPSNFESYVQEIGRAGRDGKIAHCHLFLDSTGNDKTELRRHIYANSIDRHVIRKLLQRIFIPCSCNRNSQTIIDGGQENEFENSHRSKRICSGHEIGFSVEKTVQLLDIPEENISTLLCYIELNSRWNINVLSSAYVMAKVISYGGPKYLKQSAKECPPLAMAIALAIKNNTFQEESNVFEFAVIDIAAAIGWNSGVVKHQLKNLEWTQVDGYPRRSPITVNFFDLGFRIIAPGDFTNEEIDDALDYLYNRSIHQEQQQLIQLENIWNGLSSIAYPNYVPCTSENFKRDRSDCLKKIIREYFQNDHLENGTISIEFQTKDSDDCIIVSDVISLINMYPENNFSGRNIARIFHGIQSPNYPALMWSKCKYWRAHIKADFNRIIKLSNEIILKRK